MFCTPIHPASFGGNSHYYPSPHFSQPHSYRNHGHGYGYNNDDEDDYLPSYARPSPSSSSYYHSSSYAKALERQAKQEALRRAAYEAQLRREYAARERQRQRAAEEHAAAEEYKRRLLSQLFGHSTNQHPLQAHYPVASTSSARADSDSDSDSESEDEDEGDLDENIADDDKAGDNEQNPPTLMENDKPIAQQTPFPSGNAHLTEAALSYDQAVEIIRRRGAEAVLLRQRLRALKAVRDAFDERLRSFTFSDTLDFDTAKSEASGSPVLTYTPNNRPLQAYEEGLLKLLTDLDDVPSSGLETVKQTRKALAKDIQSELSRIDEHKTKLYQNAGSAR